MLANTGGHDGVVGSGITQSLQHELGLERTRPRLLVVDQREPLLPLAQLGPPRNEPLAGERSGRGSGHGRRTGHGVRGRPARTAAGGVRMRKPEVGQGHQHLVDDQAAVAGDRNIGVAHLVVLGRVDIDVDDLGLWGEGIHPAGHSVVEPAPQCDQQIGALHSGDRGVVAVHSGHPQTQWV